MKNIITKKPITLFKSDSKYNTSFCGFDRRGKYIQSINFTIDRISPSFLYGQELGLRVSEYPFYEAIIKAYKELNYTGTLCMFFAMTTQVTRPVANDFHGKLSNDFKMLLANVNRKPRYFSYDPKLKKRMPFPAKIFEMITFDGKDFRYRNGTSSIEEVADLRLAWERRQTIDAYFDKCYNEFANYLEASPELKNKFFLSEMSSIIRSLDFIPGSYVSSAQIVVSSSRFNSPLIKPMREKAEAFIKQMQSPASDLHYLFRKYGYEYQSAEGRWVVPVIP